MALRNDINSPLLPHHTISLRRRKGLIVFPHYISRWYVFRGIATCKGFFQCFNLYTDPTELSTIILSSSNACTYKHVRYMWVVDLTFNGNLLGKRQETFVNSQYWSFIEVSSRRVCRVLGVSVGLPSICWPRTWGSKGNLNYEIVALL